MDILICTLTYILKSTTLPPVLLIVLFSIFLSIVLFIFIYNIIQNMKTATIICIILMPISVIFLENIIIFAILYIASLLLILYFSKQSYLQVAILLMYFFSAIEFTSIFALWHKTPFPDNIKPVIQIQQYESPDFYIFDNIKQKLYKINLDDCILNRKCDNRYENEMAGNSDENYFLDSENKTFFIQRSTDLIKIDIKNNEITKKENTKSEDSNTKPIAGFYMSNNIYSIYLHDKKRLPGKIEPLLQDKDLTYFLHPKQTTLTKIKINAEIVGIIMLLLTLIIIFIIIRYTISKSESSQIIEKHIIEKHKKELIWALSILVTLSMTLVSLDVHIVTKLISNLIYLVIPLQISQWWGNNNENNKDKDKDSEQQNNQPTN